jgi:hypothetical protein
VHVRPGLLRCINDVGPKIGDDPLPLPESTLPIDKPVRGSSRLARAVYAAMTGKCERETRGLAGALEWHRIAMTNSPAVSLSQRLVALVTAFEASRPRRRGGSLEACPGPRRPVRQGRQCPSSIPSLEPDVVVPARSTRAANRSAMPP